MLRCGVCLVSLSMATCTATTTAERVPPAPHPREAVSSSVAGADAGAAPAPPAGVSVAPGADAGAPSDGDEPPFVPWSDAPMLANAPTEPVRIQEEGRPPVVANHIVFRTAGGRMALVVYG